MFFRRDTEFVVESMMPNLKSIRGELTLSIAGQRLFYPYPFLINFENSNLARPRFVYGAYLFHVIPIGNDSMLDGILESKDASLGLSLVAHVGIFLAHAHHDSLMPRAANDGGEDGSGRIVPGETGLFLWMYK